MRWKNSGERSQFSAHNRRGLHIGVLGGGWTPALNAIASGQADIAQIENEPPSPLSSNLISFPVGVRAIVVYVNESNLCTS